MERHGMERGKFAYIPNGIDLGDWRGDPEKIPGEHEKALSRMREEGGLIVGYAGAHGLANDLEALLDGAEILKEENLWFVLVGQGPEKEKLRGRCRSRGLDRVVFLQPVSRKAIPDLLARMDVLYLGLRREPLFRFGVSPNKLMDYMMSGKPVVQAIEAGNDLVGDSGCGFTVPPGDARALAGALRAMAALPPGERERMGSRGRDYVMARHHYGILGEAFLRVLRPDGSGAADDVDGHPAS